MSESEEERKIREALKKEAERKEQEARERKEREDPLEAIRRRTK